MDVTTICLDLAKQVVQVHGVDRTGEVVLEKRLRRVQVIPIFARLEPCVVGIEACATAHVRARELAALGHDVRLMPPQYVKPYVRRNKSDAADAAAICEAVSRPAMRLVPITSAEQQAAATIHRARDLLIRQRTQLGNAIRGHLAEFGVVGPPGAWHLRGLLVQMSEADSPVPAPARQVIDLLAAQLDAVDHRIHALDAEIRARHARDPVSRRLATIPGVGPLIATALAATVPDPTAFASGRAFAAWLGLGPRQHSTGGRQRLGRISREGDPYLRRLLIIGAQAVRRGGKRATGDPWRAGLLARKPRLVVAVALANETARIVWAVLARGGTFRAATPA